MKSCGSGACKLLEYCGIFGGNEGCGVELGDGENEAETPLLLEGGGGGGAFLLPLVRGDNLDAGGGGGVGDESDLVRLDKGAGGAGKGLSKGGDDTTLELAAVLSAVFPVI